MGEIGNTTVYRAYSSALGLFMKANAFCALVCDDIVKLVRMWLLRSNEVNLQSHREIPWI